MNDLCDPPVSTKCFEIENCVPVQLLATLRQLEEQRKMYEDEGNYQEAGKIAKRIQELKVSRHNLESKTLERPKTKQRVCSGNIITL